MLQWRSLFLKQHFTGQDFNQTETVYLAGYLKLLILFFIWLKFYQDMVFKINDDLLFYVTRCVSFVTRRVSFMTHCVSFVTRCVTNFDWASKNLENTIELILWKQRVYFTVWVLNGNTFVKFPTLPTVPRLWHSSVDAPYFYILILPYKNL